jgi:hypothetical protein
VLPPRLLRIRSALDNGILHDPEDGPRARRGL